MSTGRELIRNSMRRAQSIKDKPKRPIPYRFRTYDSYLLAMDMYREKMKVYIENGGEV